MAHDSRDSRVSSNSLHPVRARPVVRPSHLNRVPPAVHPVRVASRIGCPPGAAFRRTGFDGPAVTDLPGSVPVVDRKNAIRQCWLNGSVLKVKLSASRAGRSYGQTTGVSCQ